MSADDDGNFKIADQKRVSYWVAKRDAQPSKDVSQGEKDSYWGEVFAEFLEVRLKTRYLNPIGMLTGGTNGEGFSIVTLQCALIEFLAALKEGKNYIYRGAGAQLSDHEYSNSSSLFCDFLTSNAPFNTWIHVDAAARDFYANVRCGLLHEARTKKGWKIKKSGEAAIDSTKKVVYRDQLQVAIDQYLDQYKNDLKINECLQVGFIRKFNHLCDL